MVIPGEHRSPVPALSTSTASTARPHDKAGPLLGESTHDTA